MYVQASFHKFKCCLNDGGLLPCAINTHTHIHETEATCLRTQTVLTVRIHSRSLIGVCACMSGVIAPMRMGETIENVSTGMDTYSYKYVCVCVCVYACVCVYITCTTLQYLFSISTYTHPRTHTPAGCSWGYVEASLPSTFPP